MGYKDDNYSTKVCGHHPETCTCRDWDTKEERERGFTITHVGKQETLEEVRKYAELSYYNGDEVNAFVDGVKWQQKISYSEEEVETLLLYCRSENPIDVSKWFKQFKKK